MIGVAPKLMAFSAVRRDLGKRIIVLILLASTALSLVASGIQLFASYNRDRAGVLEAIDVVEHSFRTGLENALWEFNFQQVNLLLDGIVAQTSIAHVQLTATTGETWQRGAVAIDDLLVHELYLVHLDLSGDLAPVGTMRIGLTLEFAKGRLLAQFWTLLLTNFFKTTIVALTMLAILDWMVMRHLRSIADYVGGSDWLGGKDELQLSRSRHDAPDELDEIVAAINTAQAQVRAAYKDLWVESDMREQAQTMLASKADALERTNAQLVDANREQAEFTYAISHDLKSPTLTTGLLLDEIADEAKRALTPESAKLLGQARQTVARMSKLVDDVVNYSRSISKPFNFESVDLNIVLADALANLRGEIGMADAKIEIEPLPGVSGNAALLTLLFQNLIGNAIKFHAPGRSPEIRIHTLAQDRPGYAGVAVTDNGIGIANNHQERIFGLFQRLHLREQFPGSGLGLALCKRIVTRHGGEMEVNSELDRGSTFGVLLRRDDE